MPFPSSPPTSTILVVDDERLTLAIMGRLLEQNGYKPLLASSGSEARKILEGTPVDLVLLDVNMPDANGWEVLTEIREQYDEFQLPVIMFTASEDRTEIVRMFDFGANDYVSKPFDPDVTLARVEMQLRLKIAQQAVRLSEERYALAARATNDGLWDWDLTTDRMYYSPRWKQIVGLDESLSIDSPDDWLQRIHPDDRERLTSILDRNISGELAQFDTEFRIRHEDGNYRWVICRGVTVQDSSGRNRRMAGAMTDITGGKVADVLTGLPNRLLFKERVNRCIEEFQRNPAKQCAILYLDLDNFKYINDTFGHGAGDQVLMTAARRLENVIRSEDAVAARFGGDEFAILLESISGGHYPLVVAERIHDAMSHPISINDGREVFAQASVGIALISGEARSADELLSQADIAMYNAKSHGKGRTSIFDKSMHAQSEVRLMMETELRKAVQRKAFHLHYQPIYDLIRNELVGFEALVRWEHPELGKVPTPKFIRLAEELNLIQQLGDWIINEACSQLAEWHMIFPNLPNLFVGVNISSKQLSQKHFVENLLDSIDRTGITGRHLKLELTESAIMKNLDRAVDTFKELQSHGIRIAIDDFGTGFSSLAYLHRLPLNILKIDRSFTERILDAENGEALVRTILSLASNLKLATIAEGVETPEQAVKLQRLGCQLAQGFLFSPPVPPQDAALIIQQAAMHKADEAACQSLAMNNVVGQSHEAATR